MKAIVQDKYGSPDVLGLEDIDKPEIGDGDVLVVVLAASAHIGDWHFMTGSRDVDTRCLFDPMTCRRVPRG